MGSVRRVALALAVSVLATGSGAACSSSDSGAKITQQPLSSLVLQDSDLPAGWMPSPHPADADDDVRAAHLARCLGIKNTRPHVIGSVDSDDYVHERSRISSSVARYRSQGDVDTDVRALQGISYERCEGKILRAAFADRLPATARISKFEFDLRTSPSNLPRNVEALGEARVVVAAKNKKLPATPLRVFLDIAYISGPQIEGTVIFNGSGGRIDSDLRDRLVRVVAKRVANA